ALLHGPCASRLDSIAWVINHQIESRPENAWNGVLDAFGKLYGAKFYIFDTQTAQLAGQHVQLPAGVLEKIGQMPTHRLSEELSSVSELDPKSLMRAEQMRAPTRSRFLLHTQTPDQFWIGLRLRPFKRGDTPRVLIISAHSLWQTRLFVD